VVETNEVRPRHSRVGAIVAAIGGAVVIAGTLFDLVSVTHASKTYIDTNNGKVVAAMGVGVLVVALAALIRPGLGIIVPVVIAAAGLAAFGFALYDRIDLNDATDAVNGSFGPALYLAMAGGIVATVGAMLLSRDG